MPGGASHTVRRTAPVAVERLFDTVVAEDVLPHVLRRWGPVPGVVGTRELTGPWDTPGSSRTVVLQGGRTARETVLVWERPDRFEYRVDQFLPPTRVGRLIDHAVGAWRFAGAGSGSAFEWTYTFMPAGGRASLLLALVAGTAWARYMEQCADLCVARAVANSGG